jgi:hypothetical protein
MLGLALVIYSVACLHVARLSHAALVRSGSAAAGITILANIGGIIFGGPVRAIAALPLLLFASLAAARAFKLSDDVQRDTDEEAKASRAGMALVGVAMGEAFVVLIAAFVWLIG